MADVILLLACVCVLVALAWRSRWEWDDEPWFCECIDPLLDELGECRDCGRPHPSTLGLDQ